MTATVSPESILKDLANLWVDLARQEGKEGAGVLRACTMTLIVVAEETEDVGALGETLAALMPEHPARSILIRLRGQGEADLSERVYAQCWMPFGQRRQICCEQIEITATDAALADIAPVVLPLAVPDLPVIIWLRSARLWDLPAFRSIAAMARKIVVDSATFPSASGTDDRFSSSVMLESFHKASRTVILGDLTWARLTRWREMLSQLFENREYLAQLDTVSQVRVTFGPSDEVSARYLAAWVAAALPQTARLEMAAGEDLAVELSGPALRVRLSRAGDKLTLAADGHSQCSNLPPSGDYQPLREELGLIRHDPVFERTLAAAAALQYPTDK